MSTYWACEKGLKKEHLQEWVKNLVRKVRRGHQLPPTPYRSWL